MGRRLVIAAVGVGVVVLALVLFLGDSPAQRPDGLGRARLEDRANQGNAEPVGAEVSDEEPGRAELAGAGPVGMALGAAPMRAPDMGRMTAMTSSMSGAREALADPLLYETEHERAKRLESQARRRWRALHMTEELIVRVDATIEEARAAGETERVETLEASRQRLVARRDGLREAVRGQTPPEER